MVAVLMGSRTKGTTSWAAVRGRKWIVVEGFLVGDALTLVLRNGPDVLPIEVTESCVIEIPSWATSIRAQHTETSGNPVFVDLR